MMIGGGMTKTLIDALVSILKVVFSDESDVYLFRGFAAEFQEMIPGNHPRCLPDGNTHLSQNGGIETLSLHVEGHFVDAGQVFALNDTFQIDIAETSHFLSEVVVEM